MMKSQYKNRGRSFSDKELESYFSGTMSGSEMNKMELEALNNPFLAEAMEGYEGNPEAVHKLSDMKNAFNSQIEQKPYWRRNGIYLSAASLAALIIATLLINNLLDSNKDQIAQRMDEISPAEMTEAHDDLQAGTEKQSKKIPIEEAEKTSTNSDAENVAAEQNSLAVKPQKSEVKKQKAVEEVKQESNSITITEVEKNGTQMNGTYSPTTQVASYSTARTVTPEVNLNITNASSENIELQADVGFSEMKLSVESDESVESESEAVTFIHERKIIDYSAEYNKLTVANGRVIETGTPANLENDDPTKQKSAISPDIVPVSYSDYLSEGLRLFVLEDFHLATKQFKIIRNKYPKDMNAIFYTALCNFHLTNYESTLIDLDTVIQSEVKTFGLEAEWYKALTLIELSYLDDAIILLLKIRDEGDFYAMKADLKLRELQKK